MKSSIDTALMALRDRMYRYARSILGSAPEAEDATHDTLERLLTRRDELGIYRNLDAFALTALRNRCIDRLRTRHTTERPSEALMGTTDEVERWSNRELVRTAMAQLPLRQREVLHLKEIEATQRMRLPSCSPSKKTKYEPSSHAAERHFAKRSKN